MHFIREQDHLRLYDDEGSWCDDRMAGLIEAREWRNWPRTPNGKYAMRRKVFGKMVEKYPELKPIQRLRDQIAELRLGAFVNRPTGFRGARLCRGGRRPGAINGRPGIWRSFWVCARGSRKPDAKGQALWREIQGLVRDILRRKRA
jgi:hypothetical protein